MEIVQYRQLLREGARLALDAPELPLERRQLAAVAQALVARL